MVKRKVIIIYFRHKKIINKVKELGVNVTYISENSRYLTGYIDDDKYDELFRALKNHRLIKRIEASKQAMDMLDF